MAEYIRVIPMCHTVSVNILVFIVDTMETEFKNYEPSRMFVFERKDDDWSVTY